MNLLDLLLIAAAIAFGVTGYRQGFVAGLLSFLGFLGGGLLGLNLVPRLLGDADAQTGTALVAIGLVLALASAGQLLAGLLGGWVRSRVTWESAQLVDSAGGAFLSVVSMLLVAWFIGSAVATSSMPNLARLFRDSSILRGVDEVMPGSADALYHSFAKVLDANGFPSVFGPFTPERIRPVQPPDPAVANSTAVRRARPSIVKIVGTALSCSREIEGSGFVYAPERVMTNAHVVAGVREPQVIVEGSDRRFGGRVVLFDPRRDIAVLPLRALGFDGTANSRDDAVVAGYPNNGPFVARAARIRDELRAQGPNIYDRGRVTREVYSLYTRVEPGNSGGPLLSPAGDVYGIIFAKSQDDPNTGYAVTADEASADARAGVSSTAAVSTGACA
jgi:S1-C subfamily serine protease